MALPSLTRKVSPPSLPARRFVHRNVRQERFSRRQASLLKGVRGRETKKLVEMASTSAEHAVVEATRSRSTSSSKSGVAGALGSMFSRCVLAPLERIRLQMISDAVERRSIVCCATRIYSLEGLGGFWRGNMLNMVRIAPQVCVVLGRGWVALAGLGWASKKPPHVPQSCVLRCNQGAIGFYVKDLLDKHFSKQAQGARKAWQMGFAAIVSGVATMALTYPIELVRTRVTTSPKEYAGALDAIAKTASAGGLGGFFVGMNAGLVYGMFYYGTKFWVYDSLKTEIKAHYDWRILYGIPCGSVACVAACLVAFPTQTVWRRIQVQGVENREVHYTESIIATLNTILREEGLLGLYRGVLANCIKLAPAGALTFAGVELVKHLLP
eukprot:scaffold180_cov311-Pinguiococcus_pyrenoidosus.AAC.55